jgi:hypothetical protein
MDHTEEPVQPPNIMPRRSVALLFSVGVLAGCGSTAATQTVTVRATTTVAASTTAISRVAPAATRRKTTLARKVVCPDLMINARTSCPFAQAVRDAYGKTPMTVVYAHSPVTERSYAMTCRYHTGLVTCVGASNASVAFHGVAPNPTPTASAPVAPSEGVYPNCTYGKEISNGMYDGYCLPNQNPNNVPLQAPTHVPPCSLSIGVRPCSSP